MARLEANNEAVMKQAQGAGAMNKTLLEENTALKAVSFSDYNYLGLDNER